MPRRRGFYLKPETFLWCPAGLGPLPTAVTLESVGRRVVNLHEGEISGIGHRPGESGVIGHPNALPTLHPEAEPGKPSGGEPVHYRQLCRVGYLRVRVVIYVDAPGAAIAEIIA